MNVRLQDAGVAYPQQYVSAGNSDCPGGSVLNHQGVSLRGTALKNSCEDA